ncbi:MAG: hypothetical protein UR61_C0032G0008 [candidate division WS6 bacterium GW2011_GWE1_34_7]|uniref:Uncharacterized protein n=1 Tax=candidate division WS6 bacterium GW2011_GWE1_34_7 TaxID=1619093 RepID=A0A0G0B719_9BACT|nr:MAG: hypothetical protein UR61_C0032G0008 [candidate division WS6 bacterium GW2011_GWE1_34_7]
MVSVLIQEPVSVTEYIPEEEAKFTAYMDIQLDEDIYEFIPSDEFVIEENLNLNDDEEW